MKLFILLLLEIVTQTVATESILPIDPKLVFIIKCQASSMQKAKVALEAAKKTQNG